MKTTKKAGKKATKKTGRRGKAARVGPLPSSWAGAKIESRRLSDLRPREGNPKRHPASQIGKLVRIMEEVGWTMPILIDEADEIIAGEGRWLAGQEMGVPVAPVIVARGWTEAQVRAYVIADNKIAEEGTWDSKRLAVEFRELERLDLDLDLTGFGRQARQRMLFDTRDDPLAGADDAAIPKAEKRTVTKPGELWTLGDHRILCGDSTRVDDVARLMGDEVADCILADPPYGMGKEKDGVAGDNQYGAKLDAFQMSWLTVALERHAENGSLYVWGNAPDLWRLWYVGGLERAELVIRNELVWDKGTAIGMRSELNHSYPPATERCLFFMRGQQFLGNQNKADYWQGWEPLRSWLIRERNKAGWKVGDVNRITGTRMAGHWFGKSQFQPIAREHYEALQKAADGAAFEEDYEELFGRLFPEAKAGGNAHRREISERIREARTFFDNSHDIMTDVWQFPRVKGEERFGHATPKPVAMLGRCLASSVPAGGLVLDPFSGTGTVTAAAELLGRRCRALELEPRYVDIAVRRWQEQTGKAATNEEGKTFLQAERARKRRRG